MSRLYSINGNVGCLYRDFAAPTNGWAKHNESLDVGLECVLTTVVLMPSLGTLRCKRIGCIWSKLYLSTECLVRDDDIRRSCHTNKAGFREQEPRRPEATVTRYIVYDKPDMIRLGPPIDFLLESYNALYFRRLVLYPTIVLLSI